MHHTKAHNTDFTDLKETVARRWPRTVPTGDDSARTFSTGLPELDNLFPLQGIPYGQLIEITGPVSSGKTSLLFRLLAHLTRQQTVAYFDFGNSFFPVAAAAAGIDLHNLLIIKRDPKAGDPVKQAIRTAELLLRDRTAGCVLFDLIGHRHSLPITLLHRLRLKTVRARALTVFLTEDNSDIIPSSMASLRLAVRRNGAGGVGIDIIKSRICAEGAKVELPL